MMNDANDTLRFGPQPEWRTGCEPSRGLDVENIEMKIGEPMTTPTPDTITNPDATVTAEHRELLAQEYERGGEEGPYPTYAEAARNGEGAFTLCSLRAIARAAAGANRASTNPTEGEIARLIHIHREGPRISPDSERCWRLNEADYRSLARDILALFPSGQSTPKEPTP